MNKETSESIEALAGRILAAGDPFENMQVRIAVQRAIMEGVHATSPSQLVTVRVPDACVEDVAIVLKPYIDNMLAMAASIVSTGGK